MTPSTPSGTSEPDRPSPQGGMESSTTLSATTTPPRQTLPERPFSLKRPHDTPRGSPTNIARTADRLDCSSSPEPHHSPGYASSPIRQPSPSPQRDSNPRPVALPPIPHPTDPDRAPSAAYHPQRLIASTNALSGPDFEALYFRRSNKLRNFPRPPPEKDWSDFFQRERDGRALSPSPPPWRPTHAVELATTATISAADVAACFALVETTSAAAYRASSLGWDAKAKVREMTHRDVKYLLVRRRPASAAPAPARPRAADSPPTQKRDGRWWGVSPPCKRPRIARPARLAEPDRSGEVVAFLSFMLDVEGAEAVLYVYEIHLAEQVRRLGLGSHLMDAAEQVARDVGVSSAMLTCFTSNVAAEAFYRKRGYKVHKSSPKGRVLRGGVVKRPDHIIMAKRLGEPLWWKGEEVVEENVDGSEDGEDEKEETMRTKKRK
ncbi:hypothetical protein W97_01831 [Coniosporium apollinis CBS 100218]|uniref:N-alpha-acetyltransferase 40 n=1 Tax=Coniosporium apollinis (strain CBS 100218) TaxID=1168221 RepID=R7YL27_CONA1|nr:uncharacterized protein W97_01831 [Coniosporium apollinis CBS 100218]EON62607.1 hypothetical protein W97_01831 [Coniosporium apollinis CBS 100218]